MKINDNDDITVSQQVYSLIRDDIINRRLGPGEKLTIKKLHEKYGASSSPIREALFRLQQDGLIEYRSNAGMKVAVFTKEDLSEIYMLLTEFDIIAMKASMTSSRKVGTLATLARSIKRSEENLATEAWNYYSDEFHMIFYSEAGNSRLTDAARKIRAQSTVFSSSYEKEPANRLEIFHQHQSIFNALKADDLDLAEKLLRSHIAASYIKALDTL